MKRSAVAVAVALALSCVLAGARGAELGFEEDFALAPDRTVPLKQLIPGTPDYYYYTCLHYQNTRELGKVDELLAAWIKRHGRDNRVEEIEYRQALLVYDQDAKRSLDFIKLKLGLYFNHEKETVARQQALPTALDAGLITRETLTAQALANNSNTLGGFEDSALDWLIGQNLSEERTHELLSRLTRPDYPNLVKLILADRATQRYTTTFGSMPIHHQLLLSQLDEMLKSKPELLSETQFVQIYLTKLRPAADVDWKHDAKAHGEYLDRLWSFVSTLPPVHNSLKVCVLYQRLELDRAQGTWDKDRFLTYLKLPRSAFYVNPIYLQRRENRDVVASLDADYSAAYLPPIHVDEPLVRSYLLHFFVEAEDTSAYKAYVENDYLKNLFAEAKLTNGIGDPEKWYPLLTPEQLQALKDRIDIDFAYTNKNLYKPEDAVSLDLDVKNVPTLIVKVFEINTPTFYQTTGREVDTDVNLDGLVANEEKVYTYAEPALRRMPRHFDFPNLKNRGAYIVEFIGNGKSSRALIRKGKLRYLEHVGAAGHVFTVLDEGNKQIPSAALWMAGKQFDPDKDGNILVPFSTNPRRQPIILQTVEGKEGFASLDTFDHQAENYQFTAGIHVDRATLIKGATSAVMVRPGLAINGEPISATLLEEPTLVITSVDRDGVPTTKEVPDFKLYDDKESIYPFQVPDRLAALTFTLRGKIQSLSVGKKIDLATASSFQLNGIDASDKVEDLFLGHSDGQYFLDVLGKTGEMRSDQPVTLSLKHRDFRQNVVVTLKSDANGRIKLGELPEIVSLVAHGPDGVAHTWVPIHDKITRLHAVHAAVGQAIRIPYLGTSKDPQTSELSLLELRGNTFLADRFAALTIKNGYIVIQDLPAGDYRLLFKDTPTEITLRIAPGETRDGWVLAENRFLEIKDSAPLQIISANTDKDNLTIQLAGIGKYTRVHVLATRFLPEYSAFGSLSAVGWPEPSLVTVPKLETVYITGRDIGDEYRYIIDRKYAPKFPGNMLTRPGLLLNPWAIRKTETGHQEAAPQGNFYGVGGVGAGGKGRGTGGRGEPLSPNAAWPDLDFLPAGSAVLANLTPDAKGVITVKRADLGTNQEIHIVAIDPAATVYRELTLAETPLKPRDLRLANNLDVAKHFTEQKQITILAQGAKFTIADATGSNMEVYDSLPKAYKLFLTLSNNPTLAEFNFLLEWPKLTKAQKQEKYSKYACHELNYFLSKKDPEFFAAAVQPYLKNKKDKTFMDHFLIGDDLSAYLQPWSYGQLNVVEQALLGQRIAAEQPRAARHIKDRYDLLPVNIDQFNFLFNTAIKAGALETSLTKLGTGMLILNGSNTFAGGTIVTGGTLAFRDGVMSGEGGGMGGGGGGGLNGTAFASPAAAAAPAPAAPPMPANRPARGAAVPAETANKLDAIKEEQADLRKAAEDLNFDKDSRLREKAKSSAFYQQLDKTEEWVENNYYHLPIESQNAELVTVNAFWKDFAGNVANPSFLSQNLADAHRNFTEIMFALSILDLPAEAGKSTQETKDGLVTFTAATPVLVFHKEIKEAPPLPALPAADKTPIMVSQNYFRADDRYTYIDNERADKYVTEEFLSFVVYGCQAVVTNPTSSRQKLDLLLQLPRGAMPVANAQYTRGIHLDLTPYETKTFEYFFYFPATGTFPHYPVHVAKNEKLIAFTAPTSLKVVETPSRIDTTSWAYISQNGTSEDVLKFLQDNNIDRLDLEKIAWRMKDADFFKKVLPLLAERHVYQQTLWSYSVFHNQPLAIKEFLQHADGYLAHVGAYINTTLLTVDPVLRKTYQHMEYAPLVNARAHKLGSKRQIVNDRFYQQYEALMTVLRYRPELDNDDLMSITYYLLLQDRVAEAQGFFRRVNQPTLTTQLQYDYFAAYMDFYTEAPAVARAIATKYKDYPVDRWQKLFANVASQLDEIEGKTAVVIDPEDRAQRMAQAAAAEPSLDFKVEARKILINYQNVPEVRINYYLMDIELLFSQNPFIQAYTGQFAYIKPNQTAVLKLDPAKPTATCDLPENFHASNVMVEIIAGGLTRTQAYFANTLNVQVVETFGQLKVASEKTGKPLAKVYVKTYARMNDGSVKFYKDGYTDLRGVFDYSSVSTNELDNVQRFSLLVLSENEGVVVREAAPPKR